MSPRNNIDRWNSNRSRRCQRRPRRTRILIVCEGRETERNYFDQMKRDGFARDALAVTVKRGKGGSRRQIAQFAVRCKQESREPYDEAWCVMDAETPNERSYCEEALRTLANHGITACLSNPAFEVWLLSHFQKTTAPYLDCDAVVRDLNPHWKARCDCDYEKADARVFQKLHPLTADAIANARWSREDYHRNRPILDCNAATEVYRLVQRMLGR